MMMEQNRCPIAFDQSSVTSLRPKRHKADISDVSKKEKVGERITALQQLVSPYGKTDNWKWKCSQTDTASVLLEAMEYIRFLQEQVKVLSAPYLGNTANATTEDLEPCSLRRKGLCLVPVSCTIGVASSNGADIWAPIKTASQKF